MSFAGMLAVRRRNADGGAGLVILVVIAHDIDRSLISYSQPHFISAFSAIIIFNLLYWTHGFFQFVFLYVNTLNLREQFSFL